MSVTASPAKRKATSTALATASSASTNEEDFNYSNMSRKAQVTQVTQEDENFVYIFVSASGLPPHEEILDNSPPKSNWLKWLLGGR